MQFPETWNDPIIGTPEERARTIASRLQFLCRCNGLPTPEVEYQFFMIGLISRALGDDDNARLRKMAPHLAAELDEAHRLAGELEPEAMTAAAGQEGGETGACVAPHHLVASIKAMAAEYRAAEADSKSHGDDWDAGHWGNVAEQLEAMVR